MSLVNYSSGSSSDSDNEEPPVKLSKMTKTAPQKEIKNLLPKASTLLGVKQANVDDDNTHENDDPENHAGRIRSFKHERGNWATYVYIPVQQNILEDIQEMCQEAMKGVADLQLPANLHISLSRTVVLQYHLIDSFVKSLENAFETCISFSVSLCNIKIYTNEEKTRTFIAFKINEFYCEKLHKFVTKVNAVMQDYKLAQFYEDASFHISFLWCLGDRVDELSSHLDKLSAAVQLSNESESCSIFINKIRCKSGNKEFTFKLK